MNSVDPVGAWARSGAMALTGSRSGPPMVGPGDPVGLVTQALDRLAVFTAERTGRAPVLPDAGLLGERAAIAGLRRNAPWSCGGAFRAVGAIDGHVGLSLARSSDLELLPALVESDQLGARLDSLVPDQQAPQWVWEALADWASDMQVAEAVERAQMLGLPVAGVPAVPIDKGAPGWGNGARIRQTGGARAGVEVPLVVDLTSLWAGPLCAHLLGLSGCRVVKVEAFHRPDGARRGAAGFFDLLHEGHQMAAVDFGSDHGRRQLTELLGRADVVLEGSRPRALQQMGITAEEFVDGGAVWLSITARGRDSDAVGFGDDVAVAAGLHVRDPDGVPSPCGDAIADPLSGLVAAAAVGEALTSGRGQLIEVSMWQVARAALESGAAAPHHVVRRPDGWWVEHEGGVDRVAQPRARMARGVAGQLGADSATVLR